MKQPMTIQQHAIYQATFDEDAYNTVIAYFTAYLSEDDANTAANLLVGAAEERTQVIPQDPQAPIWGEDEIKLRRLLWDKLPNHIWQEAMGFVREYLYRISSATHYTNHAPYVVSIGEFTAVRYDLAGRMFVKLQGKLRVEYKGAYLEITLEKRPRFRNVRPHDEIIFVNAALYARTGKKLQDVSYSQIVWPDDTRVLPYATETVNK